jgi:hypothetical protein
MNRFSPLEESVKSIHHAASFVCLGFALQVEEQDRRAVENYLPLRSLGNTPSPEKVR